MNGLIYDMTDWWSVGATIFSGIITAIATMGAVIYTNYRTKKQLKEQQERYEQERVEQFKQSKYVVIEPTLLLSSFNNILDRIIIENDYNRVLLFSGHDGFEFFDDNDKRMFQTSRILVLKNTSNSSIKDISFITKSTLINMDTAERYIYETDNAANLLRGKESIIIRLTDQVQFNKILEMNKNKVPSLLEFLCIIEYTTLANQRIKYIYQIKINNDRHIENIKDGVESVIDVDKPLDINATIFKNLQDSLSGIDRSAYSWEKMGQAQMRGIMTQYFPNFTQQQINDNMKNHSDNQENVKSDT